jgi:hypothetical protein
LIRCCGDGFAPVTCAGGEARGDRGAETGESGAFSESSWERLTFLHGRAWEDSSDGMDFELVRCARVGSCIPREGRDSDLRLVLYGMASGEQV